MDTFATMRAYAESEIATAQAIIEQGCSTPVRAACERTIARNRLILDRVPMTDPVPEWVRRAQSGRLVGKDYTRA